MSFRALAALVLCGVAGASERAPRPEPRMSFLENGALRLGVDLNLGGAITWLSRSGGENMVNSWDLGRQIQMSHYSGPVPFGVEGRKPAKHWEHLGWNPVQSGDDFGHGSRVLEHRNDGRRLHTRCVPMQWPLDGVPAEAQFETWLELEGPVVKMRCRMSNARADRTQYPGRWQEMPAVYLNALFHRVVSYTGERPFEGDVVSEIPRPAGRPDSWSHWRATERWSALVNDGGWGLGLWNPSCMTFIGGFAGKPGPGDSRSSSTGYLAAQAIEILDHNIVHEYACELIVGTVAEIRDRVRERSGGCGPPSWRFGSDRQGWHYVNAVDTGWPIRGALRVMLEKDDPQLISPGVFFQAKEASRLVMEAAFQARRGEAELFWKRHDGGSGRRAFPVAADGRMRRHEVSLAGEPEWRGAIVELRLDPVPGGAPGQWVEIRSMTLER